MDESDEVLVARSRNGERVAFEEIVRRTGRLIFARLYLETGDPHRAEDLAQETFLIAWRQIGRLENAKALQTWLISIAQSVHIDALRKERRRKRDRGQVAEGMLDHVPDDSPRPEERAEAEETRQQILAGLRRLPPQYREALAMRYLAGADYPVIEKQMGLTNGALRGLLHRGMGMLRDAMQIVRQS